MKNSSSERKTKAHKIARNWNFIKYKSIQISTNVSSTVLMLKLTKWVRLQLYPILCCIWKVTSGDNTVMHQPKPTTTAMLSQWLGRRECRLRLCNSLCRTELMLLRQHLTHWGWDKMTAIFQTTFSNAFSWIKMYEFRLGFHWSLFLRVQLIIFQHWFR